MFCLPFFCLPFFCSRSSAAERHLSLARLFKAGSSHAYSLSVAERRLKSIKLYMEPASVDMRKAVKDYDLPSRRRKGTFYAIRKPQRSG